MSQTIEIIVSPTGESTVQTRGFTGSECRNASSFIENSLGKRISEQMTVEYHQQANSQACQREGA